MVILMVLLLGTAGCSSNEKVSSIYQAQDVNAVQVKAYNDFSLHIADKLLEESNGENLFISPLSMAFALSLVLNGAEGETSAELQHTLGIDGLTLEALNEGNAVLSDLLKHSDSKVELKIANGLWTRKETPLEDGYIRTIKKSYGVKVETLDFEDAGAAQTINQWVKDNTNGRIEEIVDPSLLKSNVLMLANAIYFNGTWSKPFENSLTREAPFYLADGSEKTVQMMRKKEILAHKETESFKAVRLPYGSGKWDMVVVLPNEGLPLTDAVAQLFSHSDTWREGFKEGEALVELPRFQMKYNQSLKDTLQRLGVNKAFDSATADFSAMAGKNSGLYITDVLHKSFIEVNEQGTEAAAVTSILMTGSAPPPDKLFQISVNRPFFFAIEDHTTGAIVFMGTVFNPK
ncbi:serpin family protein [Paenibacillus wynnii]|uniref:serpin family protein n=1 Tax=Paenibacillus wynnii TaxID=268407 RepID=UPI00278E77A0|nr:serpin family protein [Paenibacillus wynnii]MDQ0196456.1 serpin B [Paenibacillus wynnii]